MCWHVAGDGYQRDENGCRLSEGHRVLPSRYKIGTAIQPLLRPKRTTFERGEVSNSAPLEIAAQKSERPIPEEPVRIESDPRD